MNRGIPYPLRPSAVRPTYRKRHAQSRRQGLPKEHIPMSKHILFISLAIGFCRCSAVSPAWPSSPTSRRSTPTRSAGSVDISTAPTTALVTFSGMMPGDAVTDDVVVSNAGSLHLRYAITSSATRTPTAALRSLTSDDKTIDADAARHACDDFPARSSTRATSDDTTGGQPRRRPGAGRRQPETGRWPQARTRRSASGSRSPAPPPGPRAPARPRPSPSTRSRR